MEELTRYRCTSREKRIHHRLRMIARCRKVMTQVWGKEDQKEIDGYSLWNYDHFKKCSCWMCGNPRRHSKEQTAQESRAEEKAKSQLEECGLRFRASRFRKGS